MTPYYCRNSLVSSPMPSIAIVTVLTGSFMTPTPTDVPQAIRSPGESVMSCEILLTSCCARRHRQQGVQSDRQLHRCAVAPVVALQAQGQATQGRDLSTLAPLRALRARTLNCAWTRRAVGEGVKSCPRAGCERLACPVR